MRTTGHCYCGAIEYTAEVDEQRIAICHCTDCQMISGGAFRLVAGVKPGELQITKGEPRYYDKTAESGKIRRLHFCGTCGTSIYSSPAADDSQALISLRIATSPDLAKLKPIAELWCKSRLDWLPAFDNVPYKADRQR